MKYTRIMKKLMVVVAISIVIVLVWASYSLGYLDPFVTGLTNPLWMSEQFPWGGILAVISVIIGFLLSQLTDLMKNRRRRAVIKRALINELSIIRETLSDAPKEENRIPDERIPLITEAYDSVKIELASFLKPDALAIVQRTYEEIRKMNLEGHGHIVIAGSSDHLYQFTDFKKLIASIDDSVTRLK